MDVCQQGSKQGEGPRAGLWWMCCFVRVAALTGDNKKPAEDFEQLLSFDNETLVRFLYFTVYVHLFYFSETCF